jgi:monoamine oxidase
MSERVVVVGGGLAGLGCAADLDAAGVDVVVVEARDRVGGRVFSHRFAPLGGGPVQTCERGAEFVDGAHTEVIALAASLGLELTTRDVAPDAEGTLVDAGGRAVPLALHSSVVPDIARWEAALHSLDVTDATLDGRSLTELIDGLGMSVLSRLVVGREVRTEYMLPPEEVSQLFAARMTRLAVDGQREVHRVVGGNDQLATGLADRLGDRVRLGTPVASIDAETGAVHLGGGEVLRADTVVAAVPLPVLSRLWPQMPAPLGAVGYGIGGKISVQFSRRVWRDLGRNGTVLSDRAWGHLWETTDDQPGDRGVLTNLLASHDGAAFAALPDAVDRLVAEADRLFPGAKGLAGERVRTDWTNDPYSLGCYACFGPGQLTAASPWLRRRYDRLVLAGEHTDAYAGFMEGALRSGRRVATELLDSPC